MDRLLPGIVLGFAAGVALVRSLPAAGAAAGLLLLAALAAAAGGGPRLRSLLPPPFARRLPPLLCALAAAAGAARASLGGLPPSPRSLGALLPPRPLPVVLEGRVVDAPDPPSPAPPGEEGLPRPTSFTLEVTSLRASTGPLEAGGRVLVRVEGGAPDLLPGDRVEAAGLARLPGGFRNPGVPDLGDLPSEEGLARVLEVPGPGALRALGAPPGPSAARVAALLRRAVLAAIRGAASGRGAALLEALLLGRTADLDPGLVRDFRRAGVWHVLVVSGFHVALAAGAAAWLLRRAGAGPPAASLGSLAAAAAMAGASGFLQPALRALVAVALAAAGPLLRRRTDPLQALFAAAGLFLLLRPGSLAEPGFQLSFAAVLGILRLAPALGGLLFAKRRFLRRFPVPAADRSLRRRAGDFLERWLPATLAAWFATAPVLVHHFGTFSTVTLPANLLVVPATSLLLLLAPALLLLGAAAPSLSAPLADGAEALLGWTAGAFSSLPGACLELPPPPLALLSLQGALLAAAAIRATPARLLLAALGTAGLAALPPLLSPPRAGPAVLVMDVGHGLAVLAEGGGRRVLFDAGGRGARVAANGILPALRARGALALDALLLSHEDVDHYSAAREVLETVPVGLLVVNGEFGRGAGAREVLAAAEREGVPVARAAAGDRLRWPGLEVRVLHPPRGGWRGGGDNDGSLVVRVAMEGLSALVAGDLEGRGLRRLLLSGEDLRADLLVLPHHGSPGTEGVEVLAAATGARVAAASAGQASPVLESIPSPAAPRLAITAVEGGIEVR